MANAKNERRLYIIFAFISNEMGYDSVRLTGRETHVQRSFQIATEVLPLRQILVMMQENHEQGTKIRPKTGCMRSYPHSVARKPPEARVSREPCGSFPTFHVLLPQQNDTLHSAACTFSLARFQVWACLLFFLLNAWRTREGLQ